MGQRDLKVTLLGDDKTGGAFGSAGKNADGFGSKLGGIGRGVALAFGGVAVAGVAGLGAALFQGVQDAASYQQVTDQLAQTLKSTGGAAGTSVEALKTYAGQLESISGVDEELILSSQNVLATFTNIKNTVGAGNDVFNQASEAALNLSTTMGGDLQGASVLVGKALNDPIKGMGALSKAGVQLTQAQKDSVKAMVAAGDAAGAQKIILGELETQFGGAAAAAGSGLTGSLARAKDAFSDIFREVGERLLPVLADAADWAAEKLPKAFDAIGPFLSTAGIAVSAFIAALKDGDVTSDGLVGKFEMVGDALHRFIGAAIPVVQTAFAGLLTTFETVGAAVMATVDFFREHDTAAKALAAVIAAVAVGVAAAWVAQATVATINAAKSVAAWFATATASTTSASIQSKSTAQIVVGWVAAAAGATVNAAKVVLGWVATAASAVASGVVMVAQAALQVGRWVLMGVTATAQAAVIAAAWLISLGPIGLVIAAVAGVIAIFVAAYKNSETFRDIVNRAMDAVKVGVGNAAGIIITGFRGLLTVWLTVADGIVSGAATALGWIPGLGGKLKAANTAFDTMKAGILGTLDDAAQKAYGFGEKSGSNVARGVNATQQQAFNAGAAVAADMGRGVGSGSGTAQAAGYAVGQNAGQGLVNGLNSYAGSVAAAAQRLAITAGRGMATGLQERSPSKVTTRIGEYAGDGLVNGMLARQRDVAAAARSLASAAVPTVRDLSDLASLALPGGTGRMTGRLASTAATAPTEARVTNYNLTVNGNLDGQLTETDLQNMLRRMEMLRG